MSRLWMAGLGLALCLAAAPQWARAQEPAEATEIQAGEQDLLFFAPTRPVLIRLNVTIDGKPFRQAWQDQVERLFAQRDSDGDGTIDVPQAIDLRDVLSGPTNQPEAASRARLAIEQRAMKQQGRLSKADIVGWLEETLPAFAIEHAVSVARSAGPALFPLLDADRDGRLTGDELAQAEDRLRARDFDDDQVIAPQELVLDTAVFDATSDTAGGKRGAIVELLNDRSNETAARAAERLLNRYDRDDDGRLDCQTATPEVRLDDEVRGALDANADGQLDRNELGKFALRSPDLEFDIALGSARSSGRSRRRASNQAGFNVRRRIDGGYRAKASDVHLDLRRNNRDPAQLALRDLRFTPFDADNNGYIDETEAKQNPATADNFAAIDQDGDKKVFREEFQQFFERRAEASAAWLTLEVFDQGQDMFTMLDGDQDGFLTPRELRSASSLLQSEDLNGDGVLDGSEIPLHLALELARGAPVPANTIVATRARSRSARTEAPAEGPTWFRKMDRNNDGDVSRDEFLGPADAFARFDSDGDKLLTVTEAEAVAGQ